MQKITFDTMPSVMEEMMKRLSLIEEKLDLVVTHGEQQEDYSASADIRFNIDELCRYLPMHPKKQTVYGWVSAKPAKIPFHKKGTLYFIKSEVDSWLAEDGRAYRNELMAQARDYIENNNGKRK